MPSCGDRQQKCSKLRSDVFLQGRTMKHRLNASVAFLPSLAGILLAASAPMAAQAQAINLNPGVTPGQSLHFPNARDYAFCEIVPVGTTAEFYQTTGTTGPRGGCPAAPYAAINPSDLATALGVSAVQMNPSPQTARRHWVMDEISIYELGETIDFMGVDATWMGTMSLQQLQTGITGPYQISQIQRATKWQFNKGSNVYKLLSPDGKFYVMQSYTDEIDNNLTLAQLSQLGSKLNLPSGWSFETMVLTQDLTVDTTKANGTAHIVRDNLSNVYQGCGFDNACSIADVPGPLPLLGMASAFGMSRKIRRRIKSGMSSSLAARQGGSGE